MNKNIAKTGVSNRERGRENSKQFKGKCELVFTPQAISSHPSYLNPLLDIPGSCPNRLQGLKHPETCATLHTV